MHSVSFICPADQWDRVADFLALAADYEIGAGLALSSDGGRSVTHRGFHAWMPAATAELLSRAMSGAMPSRRLTTEGADAGEDVDWARKRRGASELRAACMSGATRERTDQQSGERPLASFESLMEERGLVRYTSPAERDA